MKKKLYNIEILWHTTEIISEPINNSKDCESIFRKIYKNIEYDEKFYTMYLNRKNVPVAYDLISIGSVSGTVVDIRKILRGALMANCSNIIVSHNHPSGNISPSSEDIKITEKIVNACKLMDINVLDHVIMAKNDYFSFADESLI